MSGGIVSSSSHRTGILMCDSGRFVMCGDCLLSVSFPAGADYATIVNQIEPQLCSGRIPPKPDTLSEHLFLRALRIDESLAG
jgi:hypothetical protein